MSIHVTVNGNPVNIRRGRMVLSDLDQIKKNERDRRRRLRLEQVRQQSKEISNRILERAKKIAKEELNRLEKDGKSQLRQIHDRRIMEMQQRYQEELEDIGQAHASAALQPDVDVIIEKEERKVRAAALKRGKDAMQRIKETKQTKDDIETAHQERLYKVREAENVRAALIAKLPKSSTPPDKGANSSEENAIEERVCKPLTPKRKTPKRVPKVPKKSPRKTTKSYPKECEKISPKPGPSGLQKPCVQSDRTSSTKKTVSSKYTECIIDNYTSDDQLPRKTIPVMTPRLIKTDKMARYNPEDYTRDTSDSSGSSISSSSSSSSSSISDDSSYFSDTVEQIKCVKSPVAQSKVRLYDHCTRQRNVYERPLGIVERIDVGNEPNAVEAANATKAAEMMNTRISKCRKLNARRRGEDAMLRERVRRDYQELIQNLDHLAQEERKLKASQIPSVPEEDPQMRLYQRKRCQEERRKKLDRATEEVLNVDGTPSRYSHLTERVITLPVRERDVTHSDVPHSEWQESHLVEEEDTYRRERKGADDEMSREEQILDMLKKIEKQKRLLLQEFGANLPDDIFNASVKSLFDDARNVAVEAPRITEAAKPLSPEIKVINMSNCDEGEKKERKTKKVAQSSPTKRTEIAVQTALDKTTCSAKDKSVQVELSRENIETLQPREDANVPRPYPIEPKITIVTPEADDNSNDSTSSDITGMVIEIDKKEVTVTPKRKKSGAKTPKRKASPRVYHKVRTMSVASKASSPMRRFSRSQSSSRLSSPQKRVKCADTTDSFSRRVNVRVSKSQLDETDPSLETRVSIDASAESSQTISGVNEQNGQSSKPYRIRAQMKRLIRIRDTSDTSTSFASPPPIKPKTILDALTNVTPILEMLDSPGPEELRKLRQDLSPVSTPETPSPRTMMMPSNVPRRDKISRMLRYSSTDSQTNDSTALSSTQNEQSTFTDPSDARQQESVASQRLSISSQRPSASSRVCACKNPECKLLHAKLDDIHDYALKNCPEILQKYEDLQNLCTERIASLTDLIEKVRSEQKGMNFSLISPSDETSLMQISTPKAEGSDSQAVRKLVEGIEAVHAQLARTLLESQRIMGGEVMPEDESSNDVEIQTIGASAPRSKSIDTITPRIQKSEVVKDKAKPKIISDERVNIQLNRFKIQRNQAMPPVKMPERNSWPPCTLSLPEEEVIEKLSKEILEQSNSLDRPSALFKENNESIVEHRALHPENVNPRSKTLLEHKENGGIAIKNTFVQQTVKENFVPILAGIPKISRNHGTTTSSRTKPPVTLLNGPYHRAELESSGHELSTIAEFDTTDTVSKSTTSPTKAKGINSEEDPQKILSKKMIDAEPFRSAVTMKPSVHMAPVQQNQSFAERSTDSVKYPAEKPSSAQTSQISAICGSLEKSKNSNCIATTKHEIQECINCTLEECKKRLQCNATGEEAAVQTKDKLLGSSVSTDNREKNSKHKATSTSSNSFSGLSGISEITSSPSSDVLKYVSSPEEMETALKKLGLSWAVTTLKKTREASALSSSSNSDVTPVNTGRRMISPTKRHLDTNGIPELSDVSSISIKEASKSTEQAVLLKGRTSTPKFQNSHSTSGRSSSTNTSGSLQEPNDSLIIPNVSLAKIRTDHKQLQSL